MLYNVVLNFYSDGLPLASSNLFVQEYGLGFIS